MSFRISVGNESNNVPFLIARHFVGRLYPINVVAMRFGKITAQTSALILGRPVFQLIHPSLGALPQPLGTTLGADIQPDMIVENDM